MLDLMLVYPLYRRSGPLGGGAKPTIFSAGGVDRVPHAHREAHWLLDLMLDPLYRRSGPSDGGAKPTMSGVLVQVWRCSFVCVCDWWGWPSSWVASCSWGCWAAASLGGALYAQRRDFLDGRKSEEGSDAPYQVGNDGHVDAGGGLAGVSSWWFCIFRP